MIDLASIATVVRRELVTGLRSGASFALLAFSVALLTVAAVVTTCLHTSPTTASLQGLFWFQSLILGVIVCVVVPVLGAVSVNGERHGWYYELIATSLISPSALILGKFLAVMVRALLMASALLPFTGLVYFYAGVDLQAAWITALFLAPALLTNAAIGICASTLIMRQALAMIGALIIVGLQLVLLTPAVGFIQDHLFHSGYFSTTTCLRPGLQLLSSALFLGCALLRSRRCFLIDGGSAGLFSRPRMHHRFRPIPDGANPFGFRDLYGSMLVDWPHRAAMMGSILIPLLLIHHLDPERLRSLIIVERIVALATIPPLVAILFAGENDPFTMDMYRCTLMKSAGYFEGKLFAFARLLAPVVVALSLFKGYVALRAVLVLEEARLLPIAHCAWDRAVLQLVDLVLLPLHLAAVALAAATATVITRTLIGGIVGAYLSAHLAGGVLIASAPTLHGVIEGRLEGSVMGLMRATGNHLLVCLVGFAFLWGYGLVCAEVRWVAGRTIDVNDYKQSRRPRGVS